MWGYAYYKASAGVIRLRLLWGPMQSDPFFSLIFRIAPTPFTMVVVAKLMHTPPIVSISKVPAEASADPRLIPISYLNLAE